ncbi:MAG: hypothetical protein U1E53_32415 [Dongiaceae bacterium]
MRRILALAALLLMPAALAVAGEVSYAGGDGSSVERAIVIKGASGEGEGIAAEYAWLRQHLPAGSRPAGQALLTRDQRAYDSIDIVLPDGRRQSYYFDITGFFGRY